MVPSNHVMYNCKIPFLLCLNHVRIFVFSTVCCNTVVRLKSIMLLNLPIILSGNPFKSSYNS